MILWDAIVSATDLTAFVRAVPVDQQYTLNQIFPDQYDNVLEAEFGESVTTTRAAKARAWDAPPMPGRRDSFSVSRVKLPAVSQFLGRGERDRLELERQRSGGQNTAAIEQAIYDDAENNARSVNARVEVMRGDLLTDGKITIAELGGLEADFGTPAEHFVNAPVVWSDHANADYLAQIRAWNTIYRNRNGFGFGGMYMPEEILFHMLQNEVVRDIWANGAGNAAGFITRDQLNATLTTYQMPPILGTYDAKVDIDGTITNILPADKVIFVPPTGIRLGRTQWGITATALEAQAAGVELVGSPAGMVGVIDKDGRPPYRETAYVDSAVMPILERPSALFVADVL